MQNLRSSFETDVAAAHPLHVACAWTGNTEAVARDHYLQVTEADFARVRNQSGGDDEARGTQQRKELGRNGKQPVPKNTGKQVFVEAS